MVPVTTPETPVTAVPSDRPDTDTPDGEHRALRRAAGPKTVDRKCVVCGEVFSASRPTARCCSGRCRIMLSRSRRVADLVSRLVAAEAAVAAAGVALDEASSALRDLRQLVELGGPKIAP